MENQQLPEKNKQPSFTPEQIEAAKKIIFSAKFAVEFSQMIQQVHRQSRNRMMYEVFTPWYLKLCNKLIGLKPYISNNYKPKF